MSHDTAYRGYLIRRNPLNSAYWIERDRILIAHASSVFAAQRIIDSLLD